MTSLKDRYREYQENKAKLVLMVNDKAACNLNCSCCYLPYEGVREPESVLRIIRNMRDDYRIAIAGSEVLADLRYLEVLKEASQKYILSNGLRLDREPELFERLRNTGIEELQLSLDYKKVKGGYGAKDSMVRRVVERAKSEDFWVRLACIITPDNYTEIDAMCDQTRNMGADAMFFIRYMQSGSARLEGKPTLNEAQRRAFFEMVDRTREKFKKEEFEIRVNGNFGPKAGSRGERLAEENRYCYAGKTIFSIAPDNKVYGCPFLMDAEPIGELVDESRLEIRRELCNGERSKCITDLL